MVVRIITTSTSSNNTVTLHFPPGIEYVPGSLTKISGNIDISEYNLTDLSTPVFSLSPSTLMSGEEITFSINRRATCLARDWFLGGNIFKDTTIVSGSAGSVIFVPSTGYNVKFTSITFNQPMSINDAVVGGTYTRTFSVLNGGNISLSEVYLYIKYPENGIELISLTVNGEEINPIGQNGDTLFFKLDGLLLGSDQEFTGGELLEFEEDVKVKRCDVTTYYGVGWGCGSGVEEWCQEVKGIGSMTMATGAPVFGNFTSGRVNFVDACTPYITRYTFTNGGTGNSSAGGMYNVKFRLGSSVAGGNLFSGRWDFIRLLSFSVGSVSGLPVINGTSNAIAVIDLKDKLQEDPDGVGVGIEDLDGDGYYDDLPAGNTVTVDVLTSINCSIFTCNQNWGTWYQDAADIQYNTMCNSTLLTTAPRKHNGANYAGKGVSSLANKSYVPANIFDGVPFRARIGIGYFHILIPTDNSQTRYVYEVILPPGLSVHGGGNVIWYEGEYPQNYPAGGTTITYILSGDTLKVTSPNNKVGYFEIDLVYNCGQGGVINIPYRLIRVDNITTGCMCNPLIFCDNIVLENVICNPPCNGGPFMLYGKVERAENSLGWTDNTLTTRQSKSAISAYDLSKALYLDEIEIYAKAVQKNIQANNLFVKVKVKKIISQNSNILTPLRIEVNVKRGGVIVSQGVSYLYDLVGSSNTLQVINWDITSILPIGGLQPDDTIETKSVYKVSVNNFPSYDVQTGESIYMYIKDSLNNEIYCNYLVPEMYLVSPFISNAHNSPSYKGCTTYSLGFGTHHLAYRFHAAGTKYLNEVRPGFLPKKLRFTVPTGYSLVSVKWVGYDASFPTEDLTPIHVSGDTFEVYFPPKTFHITVLNNYACVVHINLQPTCNVVANATYTSILEYVPYYYYYRDSINPPIATSTKTMSVLYLIQTKPDIEIVDLSGDIQAYKAEHDWVIRIRNTSQTTAPYVWIAIPNHPNINVLGVIDMSNGDTLNSETYSNGIWYKLLLNGLQPGEEKDYKIVFGYNSCYRDSLLIIGGWDCIGFPENPVMYSCNTKNLYLKYTPLDAELSLSLEGTGEITELCAPINYCGEVTSVQGANVIDSRIIVQCPEGLTIVGDSLVAEYPSNSGNWYTIIGSSNGNEYEFNLSLHPNLPDSSLPGTFSTTDINERQIRFCFNAITDCDFIANTSLNIKVRGKKPCQSPATGNELNISGPSVGIVNATPTYSTVTKVTSTNLVNCIQSLPILVNTKILGETDSANTSNNDYMLITLPMGIDYEGGSMTWIGGYEPTLLNVTTLPGGETELLIKIPEGMQENDSMTFTINVMVDKTSGCESKEIEIKTYVKYDSIPCQTEPGGYCQSLYAQTGISQIILEDNRANIQVVGIKGSQDMTNGIYNLDFVIVNTGTIPMGDGDTVIIKFYCYEGEGMPLGDLIGEYKYSAGIGEGDSVEISVSLNYFGCGDKLMIIISKEENCVCEGEEELIDVNVKPVLDNEYHEEVVNTVISGYLIDGGDYDVDGNLVVDTIPVKGPHNGLITINSDGSYVYVPVQNFVGMDTIVVKICDDGTPLPPINCLYDTIFIKYICTVPPVYAGEDKVLCYGDEVVLEGSGAVMYIWDNGVIDGEPFNVYETQTYTVTGVDSNGCTSTDEVVIYVNPLPEVEILNSGPYCEGEEIQLSSGPNGMSYSWNGPDGWSSNEQDPTRSGATTAMAGIYTVTVTNTSTGCSATASTNVIVNPLPAAIASNTGPYCEGENIQLISGPDDMIYNWNGPNNWISNEQNIIISNANLNMSGIYTVTITDPNTGCSSTSFTDVIINPLPNVFITGIDTICEGDYTVLTGNGAISYIWDNGSNEASITVIPTTTTIYYVTGTDVNGCTNSASYQVTVFSVPMANAGNDTFVCGLIYELSAIPSIGSGFWSSLQDVYIYQPNNPNSIITVTNSGTYTLIWTENNNGCIDMDTVNITLIKIPTSDFIVDTINCFGDYSVVVYSGISDTNSVFIWDWDGGNAIPGEGPGPHYVSWTNPGVYTISLVVFTDECSSPMSTISILNPYPLEISTNVQDVLCNGDSTGSIMINVTGGRPPYYYVWSNNSNDSSLTNLPAGTYELTVNDNNECYEVISINITEPEPLINDYTYTNVSCFGGNDGTISIETTGGTPPYYYQWNNGQNNSTLTNLSAGYYQVIISDANNCLDSLTINIEQPLPIEILVTPPQYICIGQNVMLTVIASGGIPPYLYFWNGNEGDSILIVSPNETTNYTVEIKDSNGCTSSQVTTTVYVAPPLHLEVIADKKEICENEYVTLDVEISGGVGPPYSTFSNTGDTLNFPLSINVQQSGWFIVKAVDSCGTWDTASIYVHVWPLPIINVFPDKTHGCAPLTVNFIETSPDTNYSYLWNFGYYNSYSTLKNPTYTFNEPGSYDITITVTSQHGCKNSTTYENMITVWPKPIADFIWYPSYVTEVYPLVKFENLSQHANIYSWDFGDGSFSSEKDPEHLFSSPGEFMVQLIAYTYEGCIDTAQAVLKVYEHVTFYAPSAFSPDGDLINDFFYVIAHGIKEENFHLVIYDKWGEIIWETNKFDKLTGFSEKWDGTTKNFEIVPSGTYIWKCSFVDIFNIERIETGTVTVIR